MHNGIVNETRYDDPRKPIKQTSFTVKNLGVNLSKKKFTIVKKSFRSRTKPLSLDSTIPVNELTAGTFYRFRTSELFNIWISPFYTDPSTWLTPKTWRSLLAAKFFTSCTMKIKKYLVTKSQGAKDTVTSCKENKALGHFLHVFSMYNGF